MPSHTRHRRLVAAVAGAAALAATAPAAHARPIDTVGIPQTEPVRVVRVQVDEGLDWTDTGIGAVGMLALVLIGYGGARALQPREAGTFSRG